MGFRRRRQFSSCFWLTTAVLAMLLCMGCAARPGERGDADASDSEDYAEAYAPSSEMAVEASAPARSMAKSGAALSTSRRGRAARPMSAPPPQAEAPEPAPDRRMVAHEGSVTLRSPEPERLLDSVVVLTRSWGGYVESRQGGWAVIKVPAPLFDTAFQTLMRLADVVAYSQGAEDITADFRDTELRQKIVATTVARLEALVARAKGDIHKLRLLGELKRYREELETLTAQKKALQKRADFALITVMAQGYAPSITGNPEADFPEFAWIRKLDPFHPEAGNGRRLRFHTPAGLVATPASRLWRATGAEGAEMWARALQPGLKGDSRFWREAVLRRLKEQFKTVDTAEAGGVLFCRFTAHGPRAYDYWVGVQSDGCRVRVIEFYFPDEKQQRKYAEAMLAAVKQGPLKWYQRS